MAVETVTTVTVNNNCQTYLPRNRFSRCSAFCFKRLFCALYLPSADAPHAPPPPLLPPLLLLLHPPQPPPHQKNWNIEQVFAKRCSRARSARDWVGWARSREGRGGKGRQREKGRWRLSGPFISRAAPHPAPPASPAPAHRRAPRARGGGPVPRSQCNLFITLIC